MTGTGPHGLDTVTIAQAIIESASIQMMRGAAAGRHRQTPTDPAGPVITLIAKAQAGALLANAIGALPTAQALILHAIFVEKMSMDDLSGLWSVDAAHLHIVTRRALARLACAMARPSSLV